MFLTMRELRAFKPEKPAYLLFGHPIRHSLSPELHSMLFSCKGEEADYYAVEVPPEELDEAFAIAKGISKGINLTIPHKQAVLPLLDRLDGRAQRLRSVNTVLFEGGEAVGYNTDYDGLLGSLAMHGVSLADRSVTLLGCGGSALTAAAAVLESGARLTVAARNPVQLQSFTAQMEEITGIKPGAALLSEVRAGEIVINCTPSGMSPLEEEAPLREDQLAGSGVVFDCIYNPLTTLLMRRARTDALCVNGLEMLVLQAERAQEIWTRKVCGRERLGAIVKALEKKLHIRRIGERFGKKTVALTGYMGSGKSTVGRKLADLLGCPFADMDAEIERETGMSISDYFARHGESSFREQERRTLLRMRDRAEREALLILSTGGGTVINDESAACLREFSVAAYLDASIETILERLRGETDKRPMLKSGGDQMELILSLYNGRKPVYLSRADVIVPADGSADEAAREALRLLSGQ